MGAEGADRLRAAWSDRGELEVASDEEQGHDFDEGDYDFYGDGDAYDEYEAEHGPFGGPYSEMCTDQNVRVTF